MQYFTDVWQYMPHGMCLLWQPWLVVLWAGSDLLIFLSYTAIPFALLTVLRRRKDIPFSGLVVLFASFILLCGLTHFFGIVTLWYPVYPWVGLLKLATGVVSAATAIMLFRLIPTFVTLPSPAQLEDTNARLKSEIDAHQRTLGNLENLVAERTEELNAANTKLAVQAREAVHRSANLLSVVTSLARQTAAGHSKTDDFLESLMGRIRSLALATSAVMGGDSDHSADLETVVRQQLDPLLLTYGDRIVVSGPQTQVGSEAAQQLSLALHELATNAQKYGLAQDGATGIEIGWETHGEGEQQRFVLRWHETLPRGHRLSAGEGQETGFGTKLLLHIVPQMLRGSAERQVDSDRLTYRLDVPARVVLAEAGNAEGPELATRLVDETFGLA